MNFPSLLCVHITYRSGVRVFWGLLAKKKREKIFISFLKQIKFYAPSSSLRFFGANLPAHLSGMCVFTSLNYFYINIFFSKWYKKREVFFLLLMDLLAVCAFYSLWWMFDMTVYNLTFTFNFGAQSSSEIEFSILKLVPKAIFDSSLKSLSTKWIFPIFYIHLKCVSLNRNIVCVTRLI